MASNRLTVTDLDFDTIKTNLKTYLQAQAEFTDYDFEASGLSVLLDILAYNTHYNAYYLNMVANEAFMDTAVLRSSVVSHAKSLGYTPQSATAPRAIINLTVPSGSSTPGSLTIPRGFNFRTNLLENTTYNYTVLDDVTVNKGSDSPEYKEKMLLGFANNEFRVLITKTKIAQFGLNYQNCHNQIFASLDFSFEGLYQAIRRSYRFGQSNPVNIYLITTDTMQNVINSINHKQNQFTEMQKQMEKTINAESMQSMQFVESNEVVQTEHYTIKRGDCVQLIADVPNESIGFSVFSPPFAELYTYSSHIEDMGNSKDYKEFMQQFGYLASELFRVLKQGRNIAVHCMDLPIQKGKEGYIGLRDFSGMLVDLFQSVGFVYHSRVTIWKDPVVEMQRTKALGLLHKQIKKDSTMSRVGIPDYVLIFRKDGERVDPVTNDELPVELWQKYASPVWMDIDYGDTLQGYRNARDEKDEKHIAPLQLQTIQRLIHLYTNPGDVVLTPFMGIGSEVYQAVKMNRKGIGFELKESYFDMAKKNIASVVVEKNQLAIF